MTHFAKISETNLVLSVVTVDDVNSPTEIQGKAFLEENNNWPSHLWIQTDKKTLHNTHKENGTPFRGNYASTGYEWDSANQIFWEKKPYSSWVKNIPTASWISPVGNEPSLTAEQLSNSEMRYSHEWNENTTSWDLIEDPKDPWNTDI
tara:strand:- start:2121 stop:2564 length:444 start_codon:yes stop_codon:yes gene_type:complete